MRISGLIRCYSLEQSSTDMNSMLCGTPTMSPGRLWMSNEDQRSQPQVTAEQTDSRESTLFLAGLFDFRIYLPLSIKLLRAMGSKSHRTIQAVWFADSKSTIHTYRLWNRETAATTNGARNSVQSYSSSEDQPFDAFNAAGSSLKSS